MRLQILTIVWGEKHIDLFKETVFNALSLRENLEALKYSEATWNIFTDDESIEKINALDIPIQTKVRSKKDLRAYIDPVQAATIWQIEECISSKSKLLLAPPDTIFGDKSVDRLLRAGSEPDS